MIPFLLVLNERHLRAWMRKRPLKHTRLHRDYAICCVALSRDARRALCVSRYILTLLNYSLACSSSRPPRLATSCTSSVCRASWGRPPTCPRSELFFILSTLALTSPGLRAALSCVWSHLSRSLARSLSLLPLCLALFVALVSRTHLLQWSRTRGCGG
jgi:hypothetical protein